MIKSVHHSGKRVRRSCGGGCVERSVTFAVFLAILLFLCRYKLSPSEQCDATSVIIRYVYHSHQKLSSSIGLPEQTPSPAANQAIETLAEMKHGMSESPLSPLPPPQTLLSTKLSDWVPNSNAETSEFITVADTRVPGYYPPVSYDSEQYIITVCGFEIIPSGG